MSLAIFAAPRYVQGRDATEQLPQLLEKIGVQSPIVILASKVGFGLR